MYNNTNKHQTTSRVIVISVSAVLIIILVALAIVLALTSGVADMLPREDIEAKLDEIGGEDLGYDYVYNYLVKYGIGSFNPKKLRTIEVYFKNWYVYDMPLTYKHASDVAELFLEYFYDEVDVNDKDAVTDALIRCYVKSTGDPYAAYRTAEEFGTFDDNMSGEFVGIGISVEHTFKEDMVTVADVKVVEVIEDSGAMDAGIKVGDMILAVDSVSVEELGYGGIADAIRGDIGTKVKITVRRQDETLDLYCERKQITEQTVRYSMLQSESKIGYIKITSFKANTAIQFKQALAYMEINGAEGIVFDLRNNLGGYLDTICKMLAELVPNGTVIASYKYSNGTEAFDYSDAYDDESDGDGKIDVPVAVLCNGYTASAAELFCAALRDYNDMGIIDAVIVGEKTYGKGVMQSSFDIGDGSYLTFTIAYYNPPSGNNYDRVGVSPDDGCTVTNSGKEDDVLSFAREKVEGMITSSFPNAA